MMCICCVRQKIFEIYQCLHLGKLINLFQENKCGQRLLDLSVDNETLVFSLPLMPVIDSPLAMYDNAVFDPKADYFRIRSHMKTFIPLAIWQRILRKMI